MTANETSKGKNKGPLRDIFSKVNISNKSKLILVVALSFIIVIIFSSSLIFDNKSESTSQKNEIVTTKSYAENVESRLEKVLSKMKGVTSVEIFVYVSSSEEVVYLTDKETTPTSSGENSIKETTVFNKDGSMSSAVVVVKKYPKVEGVLIVAGGVSDVKLKLTIIDAVSCILCIAPTNVEVLEGKS